MVDGSEIRRSPVDMVNIPLSTRFYTSQVVVWDFFHRQYLYKTSLFEGGLILCGRRAAVVHTVYTYIHFYNGFTRPVSSAELDSPETILLQIPQSHGGIPSQSMPRHLCFSNQIKLLTLVHFRQRKGWFFGIPTDYFRFSSSLPNPAAVHGFGLPEQIDSFERTKDLKGLAVTIKSPPTKELRWGLTLPETNSSTLKNGG